MHSFLFPVSQLFFIYSYNVNKIQLFNIILPLLTVGILFWGTRKVLDTFILEKYCNAVYLSMISLLLLNYGRIYDAVPVLKVGSTVVGKNKWLLVVCVMVLLALTVGVYRSRYIRDNAESFNSFLNVSCIMMFLASISTAGYHGYLWYQNPDDVSPRVEEQNNGNLVPLPVGNTSASGTKPNIIFVIFDSYARNDVLQRYYGLDNSEITKYLETKKFVVDLQSRSTYPFTILSLSALLNMEHTHLQDSFRQAKNKEAFLFDCLNSNRVMGIFKKNGYKIISYKSWAENNLTEGATGMRRRFLSLVYNEYSLAIVHVSIFRVMERELLAGPMRSDIHHIIDDISHPGAKKAPYFIFAHIVCPHPPYIFNADGSKPNIVSSIWWRGQNRDGYVNQVRFVNSQIRRIVDTIDNNRDGSNTVIVFQADHGHGYIAGDHLLSDEYPPRDFSRLQFSTFSAYRLPEPVKAGLYQGMTSTNVFRVLLNGMFGMKLQLVPDTSFFTNIKGSYENYYDVTKDVTN